MRSFTVEKADDGRRLEKYLIKIMPTVTMGPRQKYLRLKRIRVNGKPGKAETVLSVGDRVDVYLNDECFEAAPKAKDPFFSKITPKLDIVFENEHLMIVDKKPGLVCHPDRNEKVHTLLTYVQAYLYQKDAWDASDKSAFAPALCNRIDRFTGGLVMIAKDEACMHLLNDNIRERSLVKKYLCLVHGRPSPAAGTLDNFLKMNTRRVSVVPKSDPDGHRAMTRYRVLETHDGLSLVECELLTGRTHQIRVQMANAGHPLLGDTQYGDPGRDKRYGRTYQALYAYSLTFDFEGDAGVLSDLNGRTFEATVVP
ncbi:MAG: RluA family pseudouridine synthase, partial [Clostridia bacterium]|nr:RluA family pseudouridine synthase [Clostridia bacterium]